MPRNPSTPEQQSVRVLKVGERVRHILSELLARGEAHDEVLHIAREAIANAVRHARARLIEIDLTCGGGRVVLAVRDDGIGLDPDVQVHGRPGHWGLTGMRERAARIGAVLVIRNRPARGTEVMLSLQGAPLAAARTAAREAADVA